MLSMLLAETQAMANVADAKTLDVAEAGISGCMMNQCRPGGTYTGHYTFTTWKGYAAGCTWQYCNNYLPGGQFANRCKAPKGSHDRGFADEECIGTCTYGKSCSAPTPPAMSPPVKMSPPAMSPPAASPPAASPPAGHPPPTACVNGANQRFIDATKAAEDARARAVILGATNDQTAKDAADANYKLESLAADAARKAAVAEHAYAKATTEAHRKKAEELELASRQAELAVANAEKEYGQKLKADTTAWQASSAAMTRAMAAHAAAEALRKSEPCTACPDPKYMDVAYTGKICYSAPKYAEALSAPCGEWCTNDPTFGSGCGDPSKKMCDPKTVCKNAAFPFPAYRGKICYSKEEYQTKNTGPCEGWCTNDGKFGSGCGDPSKKMC